jgi:LacI family transcriptional regulator
MEPTQADVARSAGVSQATVSLALRGHPRISAGTRRRIEEAATRLGYRLNPWYSQMAGRRTGQGLTTVAYLHGHDRDEIRDDGFFSALRAHGSDYGFRVDPIAIRGYASLRVNQILRTRGIRAVLLAQTNPSSPDFDLRLEHHSIVQIGWNKKQPLYHRVIADLEEAPARCLKAAIAAGCRHIALLVPLADGSESDRKLLRASHGSAQVTVGATVRVLACSRRLAEMRRALDELVRDPQVDAVVISGGKALHRLSGNQPLLPREGVHLWDMVDAEGPVPGLRIPIAAIAQVALRRLRSKLSLNEIGPPSIPETIAIPMDWHE